MPVISIYKGIKTVLLLYLKYYNIAKCHNLWEIFIMVRKTKTRNFLVYGFGLNDVYYNNDGSKWIGLNCVFYQRWNNMLDRCYGGKAESYENCKVSDEWLIFSNFKKWMEIKNWKGKELDKDIRIPGNKIYSKDTCCFVDKKLNNLFRGSNKTRGDYPKGVSLLKKYSNRYKSRIRVNGKVKSLGVYSTIDEASKAYIKERAKLILSISKIEKDNDIKKGLIKHYDILIAKL